MLQELLERFARVGAQGPHRSVGITRVLLNDSREGDGQRVVKYVRDWNRLECREYRGIVRILDSTIPAAPGLPAVRLKGPIIARESAEPYATRDLQRRGVTVTVPLTSDQCVTEMSSRLGVLFAPPCMTFSKVLVIRDSRK